MTGFREALRESERWASEPLGWWQSEGSCSFTDRAREEIGALIAQHSFRLPEDRAREIDHLYREAEAALLR